MKWMVVRGYGNEVKGPVKAYKSKSAAEAHAFKLNAHANEKTWYKVYSIGFDYYGLTRS